MAKSKRWALIDNYHDRSLLRNAYISYVNHHVFTDLGWNPSYVHCDFVLNGEYKGNYTIAERIKLEDERINVPEIIKVTDINEGGFLCEIDERYDEPFHFRTTHGINSYSGETGVAICLKDPDDVSETIFNKVQSIVQTAEDVLFSSEFDDKYNGYPKFFDINSLVDWYLIHELACMYDASSFYTSAFFFYNPADAKLHMGPCWDYDTGMRSSFFWLKDINPWYKRLYEDNNFRRFIKERWNDKKLVLKESVNIIDDLSMQIRVSADLNFMRWQVLGEHYELNEWETLKTYEDNVKWLKQWVTNRISYLDENL